MPKCLQPRVRATSVVAAVAGGVLSIDSPTAGEPEPLFPAVIELSSLDGTNGFVLNGIVRGDRSGWSVSSAGDVNGDGINDLIVGAYGGEPNGIFYAGESYVVFGGAGVGSSGSLNLSSLDGSDGFVLNGIEDRDYSGRSVSSAGDVNGDGFDDLIIGAWGADPNGSSSGQSYVVFGRDTSEDVGFPAEFELSSLLPGHGGDGSTGFVLNGINARDYSGWSVSSAGDVNGDGFDDLIIGAVWPEFGNIGAGASYVVFGGPDVGSSGSMDLSSLDGCNGFVLTGIDAGDLSGWSVSPAGDVNDDGIDDLIIGAPNASRFAGPNSTPLAGQSYVVFGGPGVGSSGSMELSSLDGRSGFVLNGIDSSDLSGRSVSFAGDVNGDGVDDVIIGAPFADPNGNTETGESYVVFGRAGVGSSWLPNLSALNGANGFVLNGIDAGDRSGWSVASAGDVNSDGIDDLFVGAYAAKANGNNEAGESYVVFGRDRGSFPAAFELSSLLPENGGDGRVGIVLIGIDVGDRSSWSVSPAGDVNGDSIDDLIIGAPFADPNGNGNAGESYVVFGRSAAVLCIADVTTPDTKTGEPGYGTPDGAVTVEDLTFFIEQWINDDATIADVTTIDTNPGEPGYAEPDGNVDVTDLTFFVEQWIAGCA